MTDSARVILEVTAGIIAGQAEARFTRRYGISSTEWEAAPDDGVLLAERNGQALGYAAALMGMPDRLNWVRVDWIWL